jgi:hypothetical protein
MSGPRASKRHHGEFPLLTEHSLVRIANQISESLYAGTPGSQTAQTRLQVVLDLEDRMKIWTQETQDLFVTDERSTPSTSEDQHLLWTLDR